MYVQKFCNINNYYLNINKFYFKNLNLITRIFQINISFFVFNRSLKKIGLNLLGLELITLNKKNLYILKTSRPSLLLRLKMGYPIGGEIRLTTNNIFLFLENFFIGFLNKKKVTLNFSGFCFCFKNLTIFKKINYFYNFFKTDDFFKVSILITAESKNQFIFFKKLLLG